LGCRDRGARRGPAAAAALLAVLLAGALPSTARAQRADLVVKAPAGQSAVAHRIGEIDQVPLARALADAGLPMPQRVRVLVVPDGDPRAGRVPAWVVGLAAGVDEIAVFPDRIGSYPYGSLESVVRHEIVHLALNTRAAERPLPRWFHEGVAVTVESGWGSRENFRLLLAAFERPAITDLHRLFASDAYPETSQAYLLSAALVHDVRARYGSASPGAIAGHVASGVPFEAAFERVTGERVDEVASRAWAGYRRLSHWIPIATSPSAVWLLILAVAALAFVFSLRRRRALRRRWDDEDEIADR
jgi:hypothetical protein